MGNSMTEGVYQNTAVRIDDMDCKVERILTAYCFEIRSTRHGKWTNVSGEIYVVSLLIG